MVRGTRIVALALLVALVGGSTLVVAQDGQTGVGTPVTYVDPDGVTRGTVTVSEVADPFEDFEPNNPPAEGSKYVLLTVVFEAAADQTLEAQPWQVVPQDTNGYLYSYGYVPRPADAVIPDLQGQTMAPGNRISGVIGYVVPADAQIDQVFYAPASDRSITLADLVPGGGPAPGQEVPFTNADGASVAITTEVSDPFTEFDPAYPPDEGMRYVALTVAFDNAGTQPFDADPYDVLLRDANGFLYSLSSVYRVDPVIPDLQSQTMAPGNRISGFIGFEVPADAVIQEVAYQPQSDRRVVIADLAGGGPAGSPAPVASATLAPTAPPAESQAPVPSVAPPPTPGPEESAGTAR
jgi:hypothetical protein